MFSSSRCRSWEQSGSLADGLEIHAGYTGSLSNLFAAASHLRATRTKSAPGQFEGMAEMVVTMQETFAGIRVIKSFAREAHQEKEFKRSNQMQFSQMMRIIRSMEAVGPLVETIAAIGVGMALLYVYAANLSAGRFFGLISGIFILYDPIKTLSKLQLVMQHSIAATTAIFSLLDSEPTVQDAPNAVALSSSTGPH